MAVEVRVPAVLRKHTGGARVVESQGKTVAEVLDHLDQQFPGLRGELLNESGQLRQFVNIYVNDEDIRYLDRLETALSDGDQLAILPAVAGGANIVILSREAKNPCLQHPGYGSFASLRMTEAATEAPPNEEAP